MTAPARDGGPIRVLGFFAENVKMLKVAEFAPSPRLVAVSGKNASGKSSLIDAIMYTLGGAKTHPPRMIRAGEERMEIRLDLGEFTAIRRASADGETELTLELPSGAVINKPQQFLDAIRGELGWDPIAFTRMDQKAQLETLRKIVKLDIDLDVVDADIERLMEERRLHKPTVGPLEDRKLRLRPLIDPERSVEPIDTRPILDRLEQASGQNATLEQERRRRATMLLAREGSITNAKMLRENAARLIQQAEQAEERALEQQRELDELPPLVELPADVATIRLELTTAEAEKKLRETELRHREEYSVAYGLHKAAVAKEEQLTFDIEAARLAKREAIARAKMPIAGLSFGDDGVTFKDVPFRQASQAEQIRVAMAIGMAINPRLRLICIRDGSLLDSASLALVEQMAEEYDYQVWIEMVDETGTVGIAMRDGRVVAIDGKPTTEEK
jgi:energy-coupling factor transporter ATP-binding protein EcfA2